MHRKIILFLFSCLALIIGRGQQLYFKHFTVDDGLPSNELYQVLQDSAGNLLIATDRGAVRYDGYSFVDIPVNNKLTSRPVYYIYQSPERATFFSGLQGKIYRYRGDTLFDSRYNDPTAKLFNHPGILIANAISVQNDTAWISFNNDYNYNYKVGSCFVTENGAVKKIEKPDGIYFDLPHQFFYRQLSLSSMAVTRQPVFITWPDGLVTRDEIDLDWLGGYIRRLYVLTCGEYSLFSIGRELFVYDGRKKVSSYHFPENVLDITIRDAESLYVSFENKGVGIYRLKDGKISATTENYLDGYSVTCVYSDNQNGMWFSTLENGLFYHHPSQVRFWPAESKIASLAKGKDNVYIGHSSGLIQVFSGGKPQDTLQVPLLPESSVKRITVSGQDSLIVITDKGFFTFQQNDWTFYQGHDIQLLPDGAGLLYGASAATADLHIYNKPGGKLLQKKELSKRIISMFVDSGGDLWIGTWEGLLKYEKGKLIDYSIKHPVFKDRIVSIGELPDGHLAVATLSNGLAVYKNNAISRLNVATGLRSSIINAMEIDGENIWIGTNKGLAMARFEQNRFRIVHLGLEAGLPTLDVHQFSANNGWLYIKWVNRLVVLNTKDLLKNIDKTRTKITAVLVNDKAGNYQSDGELNYDENALTFHFTNVNLSAALQQEYSYRLEGFDKSWHQTKERYARYTNLTPGKYRFIVQAINLQDKTPSIAATYAFSIHPAFWQQWWFPFVVVGIVVFLLVLIFQMRLNAIKEKNDLLLDLAENRQKVLVQLIHPHFVFNVLNTIQGAVLKQEKMVAASLIARFAKLMRLSMELSKEKWVKLEKEIELLEKYFELEEIRSPGRFSYQIEAQPPVQPSQVMIPSMLIQPFVENAIKHGIMHLAGKKGSIVIQLRQLKEGLICTVDDNGIGRQQAERINKHQREEHESSGIEITINRLRLLHREQGTPFRYEVTDKQDETGKPDGTTIIFSIPYKTAYATDQGPHHR